VKVIALSSHSDSRYVNAILDAGACGYLLKANAYDDLRRALTAACQGKSYLCPDVTQAVVGASLFGTGLPTDSTRAPLSPREMEVLQLLAEGLTSSQIGKRLFVATTTVDSHRRKIMRKLGIHNVADLTKYAVREGLTPLDS
jgi:two-component system NarL family response regulator